MRDLEINKRKVYYAEFVKSIKILDSDGNETGESTKTFGTPMELWINVSPVKGKTQRNQYGITEDYDRTLVSADILPITKTTRFWIDDLNITHPHDYIVSQVNELIIAVKKVR